MIIIGKDKAKLLSMFLHLVSEAQQFSLNDQTAADYFVPVFYCYIIEMICHFIAIIAQPVGADRVSNNLYSLRLSRGNGYLQIDLFVRRRQSSEYGKKSAAADIDRLALNGPRFTVIVGKLSLKRLGDYLGYRINPEELPHLLMADGFPDDHLQRLRIVDLLNHRFERNGRSPQVNDDNAWLLKIDIVNGDHARLEDEGKLGRNGFLVDTLRSDPVRTVLQWQENPYGSAIGDVFQGVGIKAHVL